jgi:hypothetical protein
MHVGGSDRLRSVGACAEDVSEVKTGRAAVDKRRGAPIPGWSARHRLVCTRLVRVRIGRLEKFTELLA